MQRVIKSLENGTYRKIICGAANTSERQIERMSLVYSLSGADVIDIAPQKEMYDAAKRGITRAAEIAAQNPYLYPKFYASAVMKSINIGNDRHFRKAHFNLTHCMQCLQCVKTCQAGALTTVDGKQTFDSAKCYGCAMCVESCQHNAISMVKVSDKPFEKADAPDSSVYLDGVELHTGTSSIEEVNEFIDLNKNVFERAKIVSVSVETTRFNSVQLVEYANALVEMFDVKIIIQADGLSMRGGGKSSSTLPTLASASILIDAGIGAYIQLSGGTNNITQKLVDMSELKVCGIGFGTFAKKIILPYIEEYSDEEFMANLPKIVDISSNLIEKK